MKFLALILVLLSIPAWAVPTALTVQEISETAFTEVFTDADQANTNSVSNPNGDVFLMLQNPTGSPGTGVVTISAGTATVEIPGFGPLTKSDLAVSLTAGEVKIVGPLQSRAWNNSSGLIILTTTGAGSASVAMKALRLKPSLIR